MLVEPKRLHDLCDCIFCGAACSADVSCLVMQGYSCLMYACMQENLEAVKLLLSAGADVNAQTDAVIHP